MGYSCSHNHGTTKVAVGLRPHRLREDIPLINTYPLALFLVPHLDAAQGPFAAVKDLWVYEHFNGIDAPLPPFNGIAHSASRGAQITHRRSHLAKRHPRLRLGWASSSSQSIQIGRVALSPAWALVSTPELIAK
jgi:hypothetical protein